MEFGRGTCSWALAHLHLLNGLTYVQTHLHAVAGMGGQRHRQARHAVVAVTQDLDPHALVGLQGKQARGMLRAGLGQLDSSLP